MKTLIDYNKIQTNKILKYVFNIGLPLLAGIVFILIWQFGLLHIIFNLKDAQLPLPSRIIKVLGENLKVIFKDSLVTMNSIFFGLIIGSALGYFIALIATIFPKWGKGGLTIISAFNAIPIVALSPIMNVWFMGEPSKAKIAVVSVLCMVAMSVNGFRGLNDLKPFALDLMDSYAAKKTTIFIKLRLFNSIPYILTALKINIASAMIGAVISEYFSTTPEGLGYKIKNYFLQLQYPVGWAYVVFTSILGIVLFSLIILAEKKLLKWHSSQR